MKKILLIAILFSLAAYGCQTLADMARRSVEPDPVTQEVPLVELAKEVPEVIGNPLSIDSWLDIASAVAYILAGAGGVAAVNQVRKKRQVKNAS